MPTSSKINKPWIFERFLLGVPKDGMILDVGAGEGTYAKKMKRPEQVWVGVEAFFPYIEKFSLFEHYDEVIFGDIRAFDYVERYDAVIFGDVLEHMSEEEAHACVHSALRNADHVLISCPIGHVPQGAVGGNKFERHLHDWDHEKFLKLFEGFVSEYAVKSDPDMRNIAMGAYHLRAK
jgi:2-polyprenyl-3-methyl-5-hydroxy-6-metoxy-1,4-benzoquinol methylase